MKLDADAPKTWSDLCISNQIFSHLHLIGLRCKLRIICSRLHKRFQITNEPRKSIEKQGRDHVLGSAVLLLRSAVLPFHEKFQLSTFGRISRTNFGSALAQTWGSALSHVPALEAEYCDQSNLFILFLFFNNKLGLCNPSWPRFTILK